MLGSDPSREVADRLGVIDVEGQGNDSWVRLGSVGQDLCPATGNNDLVTQFMQRFGQAAPDTGTAAGDKNGITRKLHRLMYPPVTMLSMET